MREQLDHQMADALALGRALAGSISEYSQPVRRALRLAYAMHYGTLLEFFHNGRAPLLPASAGAREAHQRDIIVSDVLRPGRSLGIAPTVQDKLRFRAADRLAAHLSRDRTRCLAGRSEWGNPRDRRAIRRRVKALMVKLGRTATRLPLTLAELQER